MPSLPSVEILDLLEPAYRPCPSFVGKCRCAATWRPLSGHIPRGYLGATASISRVEVVLLTAEPGDPHPRSTFKAKCNPHELVADAVRDTHRCFHERTDEFHRNVRCILDLVLPGLAFEDQLAKAWITNTYLCSAAWETASVPARAEKACVDRYLRAQLQLFSSCPIIALGKKAERRAMRLRREIPDLEDRVILAHAASPPGSRFPQALPSWRAAAKKARARISQRQPTLGQWLVENVPRGTNLDLPNRSSNRPIPCLDEDSMDAGAGRDGPQTNAHLPPSA